MVDPKDAMLVAVERDRLAPGLQIGARRVEISKGRLALDKLEVISRLVASSTNTSKVHCGPRSSNHQCSLPSTCTSSPIHSRRGRGWWMRLHRCRRSNH